MRSSWVGADSFCAGSASMLDPATSLALAEQVAETARRLGFETVLIGAAALAVHGYTRGTEDIDLAVAVDPHSQLVALEQKLAAAGLYTRLRLPDDVDPLGGVLSVWISYDEFGVPTDIVEIVNFLNPGRIARTPAVAAIVRAQSLPGSALRCVAIEDLVALKLYAGGLGDLADIVHLLAQNPGVDSAALRSVAAPFDTDGVLDGLIEQASKLRAGRRVGPGPA